MRFAADGSTQAQPPAATRDAALAPHAGPVCSAVSLVDGQPDAALCGALQARAWFGRALCVCEDLKLPLGLQTDAFDSAVGGYVPGQPGGDVGTNGRLSIAGALDVRGALTVSGTNGPVTLVGADMRVSDSVKLNAELNINAADTVLGGDLWINGRVVSVNASLHVAGRVYQAPGADNAGELVAGAGIVTQPVTVAPPCACSAQAPFDLAAIGESFSARNDNLAAGLARSSLRDSSELTLPCGRFVFDASSVLTTRWSVRGPAAIFVEGDMVLTKPLQVELDADSELDVFVHGPLSLGPGAAIDTERPGALRLYVSGADPIVLRSGARLACSLYAPAAQLTLQQQPVLYGGFAVRAFSALSALAIHYDRGALRPKRLAGDCPAAP